MRYTHLYAHDFAPPPGFLFVWCNIEGEKTLELLIFCLQNDLKISECAC